MQNATPSDEAPIWHVLKPDSERIGPLSANEVRAHLASGDISAEAAVWSAHLGDWQRLCDVPALA